MKYYRHYKGKYYCVIGEASHSETLEKMVVYQALYGEHALWVRPKEMFFETVTLPDGTTLQRFAPCTEEEAISATRQASDDNDFGQLANTIFNDFKAKGYVAEDFAGGCSLCGEENEFALDAIEHQLRKEKPNMTQEQRDKLTAILYKQIQVMFENEERN